MAAALNHGPPVGVVLAGGLGRRLGGDKAIVELEGRPLLLYPLEALHELCDDVVVVAKRDTMLPPLAGAAELWIEPDEPRHPLARRRPRAAAGGGPLDPGRGRRPAADGRRDAAPDRRRPIRADAAVVVPRVHGRLQPLCALYTPRALPGLEAFDPGARATDVVEGLGICEVAPPDPSAFYNVNRPEDLLQVSVLAQGRAPAMSSR